MNRQLAELFHLVASPQPGPWWLGPPRALAGLASWGFGLGAWGHHTSYDLGLARVRRLPAPVVGVGNLTVGGTGKTPLVALVARILLGWGLPCAVISRGYGRRGNSGKDSPVTWVSRGAGPLVGPDMGGDEPVLLARQLPVPVAVGADRFAVGREVLRQMGPCVLIGDDLFQHRGLHRDLDLVALDAAQPLGNGRLLPRGFLREPPRGLRRAQVVVLTHAQDPEQARAARNWLRGFWGIGPVLSCRHRLSGLADAQGQPLPREKFTAAPIWAFCGLGAPERFRASLESLGLRLAGLKAFADHHRYASADIQALWRLARASGCQALVTSEKDAVRLPGGLDPDIPIWVSRLELEFEGGAQTLAQALAWGLSTWRTS